MEKEQIIKALECCKGGWCIRDGCPLYKAEEDDDIGKCTSELSKNALALIEELTEKVEAYRQELGKVRVALNNANVDNKRLTEECENYKNIAEYQQNCNMDRGFKIKRLTEENERLSTALANYDRQTEVRIAEEYYTAEAYDELREENKRLKTEVSVKKKLLVRCSDLVETIQADTVREFAERLKKSLNDLSRWSTHGEDGEYFIIGKAFIDRIANEIINENTGEEKK